MICRNTSLWESPSLTDSSKQTSLKTVCRWFPQIDSKAFSNDTIIIYSYVRPVRVALLFVNDDVTALL